MAETNPGAGSSVRSIPAFRHLVGSLRQPERSLVQQFELRRSPENGHSLLRSIGIRRRRDLSRIPSQSVPGIVGAMLRQIGDLMRLRLLKSQQHRPLTLDHRHDRVPAVSPHVGPVGRIIDPDIERNHAYVRIFFRLRFRLRLFFSGAVPGAGGRTGRERQQHSEEKNESVLTNHNSSVINISHVPEIPPGKRVNN